jgi:hypothetical protein
MPASLDLGSASAQKLNTNKKIVAPGTRDAPKFSSDKPEGLRRFVRLMEDLWKDAGVEDDGVKKSMIGKYADEDSEEEWTAFTTYGRGYSWEEFKSELVANYPEAAAAERGTPARIRQLCAGQGKVMLGDTTALYSFRRSFMAEAKKLQRPPAAMANRELVELFIGCLAEPLASAVLQFLGNNQSSKESSLSASKATEKEARRPEDRYDLEEVCKAAVQVSENSQGMFSLMRKEVSIGDRGILLFNQPMSEAKALTEKVEELEGVQALERDHLVSVTKNMESKFNGLEQLIKNLFAQSQVGANQVNCKGDCSGTNCKVHETNNGPSSGPTQKWGKPVDNNINCFWCGFPGHYQADCGDLKGHIQSGNIKVNPEGRLRLKDGGFIPNYPAGATLKEKVERHYSKKPSQYFYGEYEEDYPVPSPAPQYPAQFLQVGEDAEKRRARLERELDLREKEEALELRKLKLEREEKKLEQANGSSRATNAVDLLGQLTEDEIVAIKASRLGFP